MAAHEAGTPIRNEAADIRRLKLLGYGLPILSLIAIEAIRYVMLEHQPLQFAEDVAIAAVAAIGILVFASLMFRLIERAEARVIRQNRELTAINAVSTAVQGELAVEQIIDAALEVVLDRTGATEAGVVVFAREGSRHQALERRAVRTAHQTAAAVGEMPHLVEIPLAHGTSIVGRMRLHLAADGLEPDLLTSATLSNIGHQLACSIEIGQLIDNLQRREAEDRGLQDVLLRISSQKSLPETLSTLLDHARDLLDADEVRICLSSSSALLIDRLARDPGAILTGSQIHYVITRNDDGAACIASRRPGVSLPEDAADDEQRQIRLTLVSPEMTLGELLIRPRAGAPVNEREWSFVRRIAELAVITISSARLRERDRQLAVLAERERIAREMHDSLAQVLGFIHLQLQALQPKIGRADPATIVGALAELTEVADDAYRDVREAILGLRESSRAGRSLFENLRAYLERYEHQAGIETRLDTDFDEPPQLSPQVEIHLIRVIQEALTNVRKHARASRVVVRATIANDMVEFRVEDDGRGFDVADAALDRDFGFGLQAMRERMDLVGGTLAIVSAPNKGTSVVARVPTSAGTTLEREVAGVGV